MNQKQFLIIDIGSSSIRVSIVNDNLIIKDSETVIRKTQICFDADTEWGIIKAQILKLTRRNDIIDGIAVSSLAGWVGVDQCGNAITPCYTYMHQCLHEFEDFAQKYTDQDVYPINGRCMRPEFGVFKIKFLKEKEPELYRKLKYFLSIKDYINLKLTGEYATDHTFSCYTMLYDIHRGNWSDRLISMAGVDKEKLPEIIRPYDNLGIVKKSISDELGIPAQTPVAGGSVDGSVGILGAKGIKEDVAVSVMGTTDVFFIVCKECRLEASQSLVVNPHVIPGFWLIGGATGMFGGTAEWLIQNVILNKYNIKEMDELASKIPAGCEGLKFIPTLLGERTPFWNSEIRGTITGIRPLHKAEHIYRAIIEANGYTIRKILELAKNSGIQSSKLIAAGGGSKSNLWLQIRSDIIKKPIAVPEITEATTIGSAVLLMLMFGYAIDQLPTASEANTFQSNTEASEIYDLLYMEYLRLISIADKIY